MAKSKTTPNPKSDSHPVVFSALDLAALSRDQDKWLSNTSPLDFISVDIVRRCMTEANRGALAQIQWLWEQLEPADTYLSTCVERRVSALSRIPWAIDKIPDLDDIDDSIAEAQVRTLKDFFNAVDNVDEAISAFGQASFRSFRKVQMVEAENSFKFVAQDNWNWCRDGYAGEWRWNPRATYGLTRGEELPVPESSILTRFCPRPIDQVAMMLCLDRKNAKAQWYVFNGRYGTPALFIVMPAGIDERTKKAYLKMAVNSVSNAAGVLPPGSDVKTAAVSSTGADTFKNLIEMSNAEIVLRATGGLLTMLTAPGAGTNTDTGNAHQQAFDDLAAAEASEIATVVNRGVITPLLDQWHPGQPHLARFTMTAPESAARREKVSTIVQLGTTGYRVNPEQVGDITGLEVTEQLQTQILPQLNNARARLAPLMMWPSARSIFERTIDARCNAITTYIKTQSRPAEPAPLTPSEIAAAQDAVALPTTDDLLELAKLIQQPLKRALSAQEGDDPESTIPPVATPLHAPQNGKTPPTTPNNK